MQVNPLETSTFGNDANRSVLLGFAESAEEIHLSLESEENLPILRAQLRNSEGELVEANINLSERIGNNNGEFAFGMAPCSPHSKSSKEQHTNSKF